LNPIKQGANPEVASLNHKRAVIYREPDTSQNQKLNLSTIKEITGGCKLNARMCNSNDTNVHLFGTHILECNEKPNIAGRIDRSAIRRFIDVPFKTTFVSNIEQYGQDFEISDNEIIKKVNYLLKNQDFKIKHRNAFFKILIDKFINYYSNGEKIDACIPQSIIDNTNEYLAEGDFIKSWFIDNYEKGNVDDYISIKDLYIDFKQGEYYSNMSKQGKRELNKKFLNEIKMSMTLRRIFKERHTPYVDGKRIEKRNVIIGYVKKEIFIVDELD
jgi:phage/plasmid-associated DNA primase